MFVPRSIPVAILMLAAFMSDGASGYGQPPTVVVLVRDINSQPVAGAVVRLHAADATYRTAVYDSAKEWYGFAAELPPGTLEVSHGGYEPQTVRVPAAQGSGAITVYLGKAGDAYTYAGGHRIPYVRNLHALGLVVSIAEISAIRKTLEPYHVSIDTMASSVLVVRRSEPFERSGCEVLRTLRGLRGVNTAGALIESLPGGPVIQTNRFTITFNQMVREEERLGIIHHAGLTLVRRVRDGAYLVAADNGVGDGINDLLETMARNQAVAEVEGEFVACFSAAESRER
ncbi:MAG: carboxypeptidase regulatory-like domain-containing protein [Bacteroidetes bacterium]|nr:carboxypeptidase regulatory-like domain-containing protein [Bacteroidota bacterium]